MTTLDTGWTVAARNPARSSPDADGSTRIRARPNPRPHRSTAVATSWLAENEDIVGSIGMMGHSLGGQITLFNLAFDNRLKAGVVNCGMGTLASFRDHHIPHNPAWFVPGLMERGDVQSIGACLTDRQVLVAGRYGGSVVSGIWGP